MKSVERLVLLSLCLSPIFPVYVHVVCRQTLLILVVPCTQADAIPKDVIKTIKEEEKMSKILNLRIKKIKQKKKNLPKL
jgi:hypothetical protein